MKAQKHHIYRDTLHNTVGVTLMKLKQTIFPINGVMGAAILNCELRVVEVPLTLWPKISTSGVRGSADVVGKELGNYDFRGQWISLPLVVGWSNMTDLNISMHTSAHYVWGNACKGYTQDHNLNKRPALSESRSSVFVCYTVTSLSLHLCDNTEKTRHRRQSNPGWWDPAVSAHLLDNPSGKGGVSIQCQDKQQIKYVYKIKLRGTRRNTNQTGAGQRERTRMSSSSSTEALLLINY